GELTPASATHPYSSSPAYGIDFGIATANACNPTRPTKILEYIEAFFVRVKTIHQSNEAEIFHG
ncbi:MAG: hypothetical protein OXI76_08780, partial [Gemmatimonadota bacterium]|nr:hypothetical protein [Gemmatimonadota bacterium]